MPLRPASLILPWGCLINQNIIAQSVARVMPAVRATGLQVSLATFQAPVQDFSSGMQPDAWLDVSGLVGIHCQLGPETDMSVVANEQRTNPLITSTNLHRLELDAFYPTIEDGWRGRNVAAPGPWRVVVDSKPYMITGVENDSQSQVTRLCVKDVTL